MLCSFVFELSEILKTEYYSLFIFFFVVSEFIRKFATVVTEDFSTVFCLE